MSDLLLGQHPGGERQHKSPHVHCQLNQKQVSTLKHDCVTRLDQAQVLIIRDKQILRIGLTDLWYRAETPPHPDLEEEVIIQLLLRQVEG